MSDETKSIRKKRNLPPSEGMSLPEEAFAYLTGDAGQRHPIKGTSCLIGRASACDIVLKEPRVSSRHALIHRQAGDEYFLVDLGSSNGTFIDGQRVATPTRLQHQQKFEIAHLKFTFHDPDSDPATQATRMRTAGTVPSVSTSVCWLMILDIVESTELSRTLPPNELPLVFGGWFSKCRQLINQYKGTVDKFLGDALFAFWPDTEDTLPMIHEMLSALVAAQKNSKPAFRWVLHRGEVSMGGTSWVGERVMGSEVHLVFRFEKLGGSLKVPHLISEAAMQRLRAARSFHELGSYPLKGFDREFTVYQFDETLVNP